MKKTIYLLFCLLPALFTSAQQRPQFTQYMFNKSALNPATTGSSGAICINGSGRWQWAGMKDDSGRVINPRNYYLNFEMPVYSIRSGIGVTINYGQIDPETNMDIRLNYAYHQPIGKNHKLSFGLSFEYLNKSIDFSQFSPFDTGDPLLNSHDKESGSFTDVGAGIYYRYKEKFYAGISAVQLLGSKSDIGGVNYDLIPHYFFMAGYDFTLKESRKSSLVLSTSALVQTTFSSTQTELSALLRFNNRYWGGLMYRLNDAVGIIAGMNANDFSFGLSYDYSYSTIRKAGSKGSPEFFIRYCYPVKPKIKKKGYYNTRYL
jgi:type IX secretion system PorP/SprF family membrane protein